MLDSLNPEQRLAVQTMSGPLLVLAGAGSGKTRVVTLRIARLIQSGVAPERIVAVTFTNKAANEMQQRVAELLDRRSPQRPEISTFHSLCVRILRRQITHLGYPERFAIYDRGDQESVARGALREIRAPTSQLRPSDLLYFISRWKMASLTPQQAAAAAAGDKQHLAAAAYRRYQNTLRSLGALDFDDLLVCTEQLFDEFPDVRRAEAGRFDHVLVDEYQDTNGSQYRIVKALAAGHRNLCVVGDDDQSIYGWRGAEVRHILHFRRDWPEATVVQLQDNYRCTTEILKLANRLIAFNATRYPKVLRAARPGGQRPRILQFDSETDEAREIVADIGRRITAPGVEPRDVAILFRTNEQPRAFETELRRTNVPYVLVGGQSFFDRKEVRDVLAYLKVLDAPRDEVSLLRIINTPPRGISQKTVRTLLSQAVAAGKPLWDVLRRPKQLADVPPPAAEAVGRFVNLVRDARKRVDKGKLADLATRLIDRVSYRDEIARLYTDPHEQQARLGSIEEVVNAMAAYQRAADRPTLSGFLTEAALGNRDDEDDKEKQLQRNAVALMTLHSAKGLEFPHVYMVGMEEGLLPHHRSVADDGLAIDEERRLCYVGITRAQDYLTLSLALGRMKWGKPRPTKPSRFLFELTGQAEKA